MASLFSNFTTSFILALGFFALSLLYIFFLLMPRMPDQILASSVQQGTMPTADKSSNGRLTATSLLQNILVGTLSPIRQFRKRPTTVFSGLSLFSYNAGQSYIFAAILVYTSIHFNFSSKQNGFLISVAHATSAFYLFVALFVVPRVINTYRPTSSLRAQISAPRRIDAVFGLLSLLMQSTFISLVALASRPYQVYLSVALASLGLAAPSFIKAHFVASSSVEDSSEAMAALTMMETMGGLLAPVLIGG